MKKITLVDNNITNGDKSAMIKFIKKAKKYSQNDKVKEFENKFSEFLQVDHSVFVNSGSSANLIMMYALLLYKKLKNKRVVVPAISWSTTVSPLLQLGLEPIVCDCEKSSITIDVNQLREIFEQHKPSVLLLVHPLGFSNDMDAICSLCKIHNVILLEDNCESLGSNHWSIYGDVQKLGTFGLMSTHSFFISHHITTIEGGMVSTNNEELNDILKMIRSHGWDRELTEEKQKVLREKHNINDFDASFTFYYPSFNVRNTEIHAVLGLEQLKRVDTITRNRNRNYDLYRSFTNSQRTDDYCTYTTSNFAYPIISEKRELIIEAIKDVCECRPLICGNIANQPFLKNKLKYTTKTPNADYIQKYGMYLPNHPSMGLKEIKCVSEIINKVIKE